MHTDNPALRVHKEDVDHLPPIYRALAQYLIETGDPRIKIIDGGYEHEAGPVHS